MEKLPAPDLDAAVDVEFRGDTSIVVRGLMTGLTYLFPKAGEALSVDGRDVAGLLSSGQFVRSDKAAGN